ncbi:hypothetical protein HOO65_011317 [Ceratocystis lukuohia]|uniref:Uncharacterized protein n=1 Tax=Ceratocystis lukuohia TaxID=2019550 RepID=A0ABR4MUM6_9PEZI
MPQDATRKTSGNTPAERERNLAIAMGRKLIAMERKQTGLRGVHPKPSSGDPRLTRKRPPASYEFAKTLKARPESSQSRKYPSTHVRVTGRLDFYVLGEDVPVLTENETKNGPWGKSQTTR